MTTVDRPDATWIQFRAEERPLLKRLREQAGRARASGRTLVTEFLSPREVRASHWVAEAEGVSCRSFGGYERAERRRAVFAAEPDRWSDGLDEASQVSAWAAFSIACLKVTGNRFDPPLRHGDLLGSLMGLGLERNRLGDVVLAQGAAYVFCMDTVAPVLLSQWDKAGRQVIRPTQVELDQVPALPVPEVVERTVTVQSLRLDAIVAHAFGMSRSSAVVPIASGKVMLNFVPCTDPATRVGEEDMLSLRGSGRARIMAVEGESRSGRTFVRIGRYTGGAADES